MLRIGGTANLSASYAASFMWNDKLGTAAAWKVPVVMRQTFALDKYSLLNADFIPIPDWYFTFLWKNLMGTRMLNVDGMFDKGRQVRAACVVYILQNIPGKGHQTSWNVRQIGSMCVVWISKSLYFVCFSLT
eukprot:TRINITY_DN9312_c1_g1_i1.p3 TRINITY_DN9312_c1_g1~~TRINITY_DN9312_c1_g1_i1.p3  ORF type:complete len:132 (+),score=10.25 TRINITY_DN9312_c1_g1_i1:1022-1417(+)